MTQHRDNFGLSEFAPPDQLDQLVAIAERIENARPLPSPGFRGALGRHLAAQADSAPGLAGNLAGIKRRIYTLSLGGTALLGTAVAGLGGLGPLAG